MYVYIYLAIVTCMFNVMKIQKVKKNQNKKVLGTFPFTCQVIALLVFRGLNPWTYIYRPMTKPVHVSRFWTRFESASALSLISLQNLWFVDTVL